MALKGFIHSDNYSVVSIQNYSKDDKRLLVNVETYQDDTKSVVICKNEYVVEGKKHKSVTDRDLIVKPALEDRIPGTSFIVGTNDDPYLRDFKDRIIKIGSEGKMSLLNPSPGYLIYLESDGQYYEFKDGTWVTPSVKTVTLDSWDSMFGPDIVSGLNNNEFKAAYNYLKTLPEWQHTTDV